jgi:hypothetical protein
VLGDERRWDYRRPREGVFLPTKMAEDQAQELCWRAFDSDNVNMRLSLAREALGVFTKCADARNILALHALRGPNRNARNALKLYQEAMCCELLLHPGHEEVNRLLWGDFVARPYLRSLWGQAQAHAALGDISRSQTNPAAWPEIRYWQHTPNHMVSGLSSSTCYDPY